jgi:hypothetical protein
VLTAVPLPPDVPFRCPDSTLRRTLTQSTANHLLNGNYLFWRELPQGAGCSPSSGPAAAGVFSRM